MIKVALAYVSRFSGSYSSRSATWCHAGENQYPISGGFKNPTFSLKISNQSKRIMWFSMCFFMILPRKIIDRTGWLHRLHQGIPRELRKEILEATGRRMALKLRKTTLVERSGWRVPRELKHLHQENESDTSWNPWWPRKKWEWNAVGELFFTLKMMNKTIKHCKYL